MKIGFMIFFLDLTDLYGHVRSSLLAQSLLPSLDRASQTLLQEERLRKSTSSRDIVVRDEVMTLAIKSGGKSRFDCKEKSDSMCSYCNRKGHTSDSCFDKNGYLDWWGDRPRGMGRGMRHGS